MPGAAPLGNAPLEDAPAPRPRSPARALRYAAIALALPLAAPAFAQPVADPRAAPEAATGLAEGALARAERHMVSAANPIASQAGLDILRAGGSAVDAAITVQLVLNIVEPQSSGIGGGAFLLHWDAARRDLTTLDGRETAPAAATPERFLREDGEPMAFMEAVVGGLSVGVPGTPALLAEAHARFGRLPWERLFEEPIRLAEEGFSLSPRLHALLAGETALREDDRARAVYYGEDGEPHPVGTTIVKPDLARTLRILAQEGVAPFYTGEIARDIVETVTGHPDNPGDMTLEDLAAYRVIERAPVCVPYRVYTICGMGPPSSGGIAVGQILALVEGEDLGAMGFSEDAIHFLSEASRLAFADRNLFVADEDFVPVPTRGLLDPGYLRERARLIEPDASLGVAAPGEPPFRREGRLAPAIDTSTGTSHVSIVDGDGNAVSLTTTIESAFGARLMTAGGFLLNNELTDFSFRPEVDGSPVANRVEPGKRPRSSMAPTIVLDAFDRLYVVVGSPGGSRIIGYVAKTLVGILDFGLDPQQAIAMPNFLSRNGPTELEQGTAAADFAASLEARGHEVSLVETTSGVHAIVVTPAGLLGGADPRREGVALGD